MVRLWGCSAESVLRVCFLGDLASQATVTSYPGRADPGNRNQCCMVQLRKARRRAVVRKTSAARKELLTSKNQVFSVDENKYKNQQLP